MVRTEIRPSHWLNAFSWCQIFIWPKTIKGQPALTHVIRNYVLLLLVPPLCLWWVTHIVTKALRLKILPGQQLPLLPNPPPPTLYSPIKYLVLNLLVMKICFQVYRDGNFFIPSDEVEWYIAFSQIVLHILVQIFMLIKHVQDMIRARWVCWHNNSIVISFFTNFQIPIT